MTRRRPDWDSFDWVVDAFNLTCLAIGVPLLLIFCLNTLSAASPIPYTLKTWFASALLLALFVGLQVRPRK